MFDLRSYPFTSRLDGDCKMLRGTERHVDRSSNERDWDLEHVEWRIDRHQLIRGDCEVVMAGLPEKTIDIVVTSPPYNIGIRYSRYDDSGERTRYLEWLTRVAIALKRVLTDDGSVFLNVAGTSSDPWVAYDVASRFRDHFVLQNDIVWVKSISIGENTSGHFKPLNSERFVNHNHESIFHFTKNGNVKLDRLAVGVPFADKSNIARRGHAQDLRCAGNTWHIPYRTIQNKKERFHHPAAFPEALPERCIKLHGGKNRTVLDPFMGTGTTIVAANMLGHTGIGIDLDPAYVAAARSRLTV
jgi:site-specific DNA-methyltransferase (adenine-specific)